MAGVPVDQMTHIVFTGRWPGLAPRPTICGLDRKRLRWVSPAEGHLSDCPMCRSMSKGG